MKRYTLLLSLIALVIPAVLPAQVQTRSQQATLGGWSGTMTYSYRTVDGREILDGKKSFSARSGEDTYLLEANYKNGLLDGAATAKLHRAFMKSDRDAGVLQVWKAALDVTLTARFYGGKLSGLLTCNYIPSGNAKAGLDNMNKQSFSANYTEDRVSGNYSYLSYGYPQRVVVNGSTDAEGFADGKWQIYYPAVDELMTEPYVKGAAVTDIASSVRSRYTGRKDDRKFFEDYGYVAHEEPLALTTAAEFFDYITGSWLKDYRKVIPYEFGVKTWSGDSIREVHALHQIRTVRFTMPTTFSQAGFDKFKGLYYEAVCGGKPLGGISVHLDESAPYVEMSASAASSWQSLLRNSVQGPGAMRVMLPDFQVAELQNEEAVDEVRRRLAKSGDALLEGNSPYKALLTGGKTPSDLIAGIRGAEKIGVACSEMGEYLKGVKASLGGLKKTEDGKFYVKDKVYYENPGWDLNLMIADARRLTNTCMEASRLYDEGLEYLSGRPDVMASYKKLCGRIETGSFEEIVGAMGDAAYFKEKVIVPDVLGKIGTREEMRQGLTDKTYSHLVSVYATDPGAHFSTASGVDAFVKESLEYASFQRNLLSFDHLVADIRAEKALLDEALSVKPYKSLTATVNNRLVNYSLQPAFTDAEGYAHVSSQLEECLSYIKDVRDYISVHQQYTQESEQLRDLLSRSKTNHISKFYRNLTKDFQLNWDANLPVGKCASDVREAIGITRRIAAVVSAPDAEERDKSIKGINDKAQIWNLLEAK